METDKLLEELKILLTELVNELKNAKPQSSLPIKMANNEEKPKAKEEVKLG